MRPGTRSAFSLAELAVVMAVIGVLLSIVVPRYANFVTRHRAVIAGQRIMTDLAFAQRLARLSGSPQTVRFNVALDQYRLIGVPDPDQPGADYAVCLRHEPYRASIASVDFSGSAEVIFGIHGTPNRGGSITVQAGRWGRRITVENVTGRTTVTEIAVEED